MSVRYDHKQVVELVEPGAKVLDLGCGEGELLSLLVEKRGARVQGIELDDEKVHRLVEKGLTVFQGDIETGLSGYPDQAFDVVVLNQSLQEVKKVSWVIDEALRVGKRVIVGFPNFGHIALRAAFFFTGRTPQGESLPYAWFDSPNVRYLTIKDFEAFCAMRGIYIEKTVYLGHDRQVRFMPNLLAQSALYVLTVRPLRPAV